VAEGVQLFEGDCLELMKQIPPLSVNLVLCDLPYGTTCCSWDTVIPFEPMWRAFERVLNPRGNVVLFSKQPFTSALILSNVKRFKYCWIWQKSHAANFMSAKYRPLTKHEDITVFANRKSAYYPQMTTGPAVMKRIGKELYRERNGKEESVIGNGPADLQAVLSNQYYPTSVLAFAGDAMCKRLHPTQKPVALMEYLIRTYTQEGDAVLDNCMGSGTTGVACANTGRDFIGIEKDSKYFQIAKQRIERSISR
jgi:DNA modification methylase